MSIQNVLVVGATGHLGQHLPLALQQRGKQVHVLIRPGTLTDPAKAAQVAALRRREVTLHPVSLDDLDGLATVCAQVDAIVCAIGGEGLAAQPALLQAAARAGTIQRFIPSEFGLDPVLVGPGRCMLVDWKLGIQQAVKASGIPWTMIYAHGFATYWAGGLGQLGAFAPAEQVMVFGEGDVPATVNTLPDIARVVARSLEDDQTINRELAIAPDGNRVTQAELIAHWEARTGQSVTRIPVPAEAVDSVIAEASGDPARMMDLIGMQLARVAWLDGDLGRLRDGVLEASALYPDLSFTTPQAYLDSFLPAEGALYAPVAGYLAGLAAGDPKAVAACFATDYRSDQPGHPDRAFIGREMVLRNHQRMLAGGGIEVSLEAATVAEPDLHGVAVHTLEVAYDVPSDQGTGLQAQGAIVFGATQDEIRWGRLYVTAGNYDIDALVAGSR